MYHPQHIPYVCTSEFSSLSTYWVIPPVRFRTLYSSYQAHCISACILDISCSFSYPPISEHKNGTMQMHSAYSSYIYLLFNLNVSFVLPSVLLIFNVPCVIMSIPIRKSTSCLSNGNSATLTWRHTISSPKCISSR